MTNPAHLPASLGCCGASRKEDCTKPPCPCNLDCWTEHERRQIHYAKRKKTVALAGQRPSTPTNQEL